MDRVTRKLTQLAINSDGIANGRVRMAAGIIYRRQLIATGVNSYKTHPMMMPENGFREGQIYLHAEIDAIRNSLRFLEPDQLSKCELRIVRVKRPYIGASTWIHGLAKPCEGCSKQITRWKIGEVSYTEDSILADSQLTFVQGDCIL